MQELINYIKTHKRVKINVIKSKYLNENVQSVLTKYKFTIEELCFRLKNNISLDKVFTCKNCGSKITYTQKHGYKTYCSRKCCMIYMNTSEEVKSKIKQSNLNKYGVEYILQSKDIRNKVKQTCLKKYGVDNYAKTKEFKDRKDEIQQKIKDTCLQKYNVESYVNTESHKEFMHKNKDKFNEKRKLTNLKKYNVEYPQKLVEVKEKQKQTCLERFGETTNLKTKETKEKIKQTCLKKYGKECYVQTDLFRDQYKKIMQNNYGVDNYFQSNDFHKHCLDIYGVSNYSQTNEFKIKTYNTKKQNNTVNTSKSENNSINLLKEHFKEVKDHYKSDKYPFACDAYIPEIDTYIEFNYHWTHGKEPFDKNNLAHIKQIEFWNKKANEVNFKGEKKKSYIDAIKVWTERDPLKVKVAKENNIKLLSFYKEKDFNEWLKSVSELPAPEGGGDVGDILSGLGG